MHWNEKSPNVCGVLLKCTATSQVIYNIYIMSGFMKTVLNTESSVFFSIAYFFCLFNYFAFAMTADSHSHLA